MQDCREESPPISKLLSVCILEPEKIETETKGKIKVTTDMSKLKPKERKVTKVTVS